MTPLEAVLKIKAMFEEAGAAMPPAPVETPAPAELPIEAAKEYELKAGGKVMIDKLEVGGLVTIADEAGATAPAPAGDHELIDGMTITVDEKGAILSIKDAAEPVVEVEIDEPSETDLKIQALEAAIAELKKDNESKKAMMSEQEQKFSKAISDLSDVIVGLISTPSASATENPKDKFNQHVESKEDKIKRFLDLAKTINK